MPGATTSGGEGIGVLDDRVSAVEANLDAVLASLDAAPAVLGPDDPLTAATTLTAGQAVALFTDQVRSRVLDVVARELKAQGLGYYTISSAGHEDNAVVGAQLRPTDPCFLHYRSGALMMARSRQLPGGGATSDADPVWDTLLSLCASAADPVSGGRHKVWGSGPGWVPPQTSTIASHLPKAVGTAFTIGRSRRLGGDLPIPTDSVVACSFGDASANHAAALAGINAARYAQRRGSAVPILFICEDNGFGISVDTPRGWIADSFARLPGLTYLHAGGEIDEIFDRVGEAVRACRTSRAPVFLHLPTVRLWGHAGSDAEQVYRSRAEIEAAEALDPIPRTARRLAATGAATPDQLRAIVAETRERARALATKAAATAKLGSVAAVVAPLAPYDEERVRAAASIPTEEARRRRVFGSTLPEHATTATKRTLAGHVNAALKDEMLRRPEMLVFGEDVARKGGVYNVTAGLLDAFGQGRVFDTLLDETTILGVAQGAGLLDKLPVPEIQYLAYLHNALDQLRGEAASTSFFSAGQFTTPMVVRVASFAYQKGFGGHFHNDNAIGALRDIPGLVVAAPARGDDAARMLRGCLALARAEGRVVAFLEPIALYHEKDLHQPGDAGWLTTYPSPDEHLLPGEIGIHHEDASDLLIVTYANGLRMSLRVARRLREDHGVAARVLDLRWLGPLPHDEVRRHAAECAAVLVVDECRATGGGIADAVVADLAEQGSGAPVASVRAHDTYVPLGPAADLVLVSESQIRDAALKVVGH